MLFTVRKAAAPFPLAKKMPCAPLLESPEQAADMAKATLMPDFP